jgi:hypothetical protein
MPGSDLFWLSLKVALGAFVLFNVYVSMRLILYSGYTIFQKAWQLLIIWVLPIFGALLVHSLIVVPRWVETDHGFNQDGGDNPPGTGLGGH